MRRAVHDLGDHGEGFHRAGADAGRQQQLREVGGPAIGGRGQRAVQPADEDVARAHVVVRGHDEMRQIRLCGGRCRQRCILPHDPIRPELSKQLELRRARAGRAAVGQIDDVALAGTVDGAVRLLDEAGQAFGMPVVAAGLALVAVHALLHHRPLAIIGDEEAVQVEIEAILHRGAVDLGHQAAGAGEGRGVDADAIAEGAQLVWRLARVLAASAADMDAELALQRREAALQRADDARGDAG